VAASKSEAGKNSSAGKPVLLIGAAGCALVLCFALLGGGFLLGARLLNGSEEAAASESPLAETDPGDALASSGPVETQKGAAVPTAATPAQAPESGQQPEVPVARPAPASPAPTIGDITFTLATTAEGQPVEPGFEFEAGLTQLHALFEYAHFNPDIIWTQVWYHNGVELFSASQPWLEAESGLYDYVIEAGGDPLPPGEWALEFYIDDELLSAGSFSVITEVVTATIEAEATTEPVEPIRLFKLAYTKWNGEKHDLYVGDSLGSREQFVLSRVAGPSWSPDGRYIFFYGEEGIDNQVINGALYPLPGATNGIVRINANPLPANIGQVKLFQGHGWNDGTARSANVSPDGSMIAYDGDRGGGRRIYFLGTAANQQFRIEIIGEQAGWSPDSQRIVYRSGRNNQTGIWISNRTDSGHIRITAGGTDSFPSWSPDGQTIAFSRDAGGNVDIYTVNVDGSNLQRLTDAPGHDTLPAYLPDGDIVFRSARTGSWGIWKMKGDGSNQTQIIGNAPVGPDWAFSTIGVLR
jgi:Tol biopolymer transport system component